MLLHVPSMKLHIQIEHSVHDVYVNMLPMYTCNDDNALISYLIQHVLQLQYTLLIFTITTSIYYSDLRCIFDLEYTNKTCIKTYAYHMGMTHTHVTLS